MPTEIAMSMRWACAGGWYFGESKPAHAGFRLSAQRGRRWPTAIPSTPKMRACRRCAARSPNNMASSATNVDLDPGSEIVITASGVQALSRGHSRRSSILARRGAGVDAGMAEWLVQRGFGQRGRAANPASPKWRRLRHRLRCAGGGHHAAYPAAAVYLAIQSAGVGSHGQGTAAITGFLAPPRAVADGR